MPPMLGKAPRSWRSAGSASLAWCMGIRATLAPTMPSADWNISPVLAIHDMDTSGKQLLNLTSHAPAAPVVQPLITAPSCACSSAGGSPAATPAAPTITYIYNDTCAPAGVTPAGSPVGAVYFTAVVQFATAVPAGAFSAANITVAAAAPFTPGSGGACGCQQQPRRSYAPGEDLSDLHSRPPLVEPIVAPLASVSVGATAVPRPGCAGSSASTWGCWGGSCPALPGWD